MNPNIVDSLSKFTYFRMFTFEHYEVMRTAGGYKLNVENPVGSSQYKHYTLKYTCLNEINALQGYFSRKMYTERKS